MAEQSELEILNPTKNGLPSKAKDSSTTGQWTKLLRLSGYLSTLGTAVPTGYCMGVVNNPAVFIKSWCNESLIQRYDLHMSEGEIDVLWSAVVSIFLVGGAVGSCVGSVLANKWGRKNCVLLCEPFFFLGGVCFYFCSAWHLVEMLMVGRFLVGLAAGLTTASLPMYHSEIAPLALRSTLSAFCAVGLGIGLVMGQVLSLRSVFGTASCWNLALSSYTILVVIGFLPFAYYPESPKWLYIVKGQHEAAQLEMKRLRGNLMDEVYYREMQSIEAEASSKEESKGFLEVLKDRKLLLPLVVVCLFLTAQQFSGISAIFFYSVSIYLKAGLSPQAAEWANLGAGSVNLVVASLGPQLMARFNRRPLMMSSCLLCAVFLTGFALMLTYMDRIQWFSIGCIVCIFLYLIAFQWGLCPIPFFIATELFEVPSLSAAMSLGNICSWMSNFIIGMSFPTLQNICGSLAFVPFSVICVLIFLLTKYYLPETRGRDPSEIAKLMSNGFRSKVV